MQKKKKNKATIEDVLEIVSKGFSNLEQRMATKEDLNGVATKQDIKALVTKENFNPLKKDFYDFHDESRKRFDRLDLAIDNVKDDLAITEDINLANLQNRMVVVEKDIRHLKLKHG